jgi:FtsP/CotA-like multicopper oxidase with cupredoxin domain
MSTMTMARVRTALVLALAVLPALAAGTSAATSGQPMTMTPTGGRTTPYGSQPLQYTLDHGVKVFHLVARPAKWYVDKTHAVRAWTYNGQVPGPLIRVRQGDVVRIVVTNNLPEPTAVHWHGLFVPNSMDGVPGVTMKAIAPDASFTYQFKITNPPGLFMYHPHYDTLNQMTKGMYGAFVVDPKSGPPKGVHEMFQVLASLGGMEVINGKSFPATDSYSFKRNSEVLIRTISADTAMNHPMHLHGFSFLEVGQNGAVVPTRDQYPMFEQDVAPGETFDQLFRPDRDGIWLYHCHNLTHVTGANGGDAGMITAFKVTG